MSQLGRDPKEGASRWSWVRNQKARPSYNMGKGRVSYVCEHQKYRRVEGSQPRSHKRDVCSKIEGRHRSRDQFAKFGRTAWLPKKSVLGGGEKRSQLFQWEFVTIQRRNFLEQQTIRNDNEEEGSEGEPNSKKKSTTERRSQVGKCTVVRV